MMERQGKNKNVFSDLCMYLNIEIAPLLDISNGMMSLVLLAICNKLDLDLFLKELDQLCAILYFALILYKSHHFGQMW